MSDAFDICIVGGGIQGCGLAQAAAAAGYRVALLEKDALASATSSRSSKLIHGGLRYLESAQFGLVAKSLRERDLLLSLAPELVRRIPFYIPVYKQSSRRPWQVRTGLSLYALLGRLKATACFHHIPQGRWDHLYGLKQNDLQAVYQYWDAQTDDVKLTRAVMHSACELGAQLIVPGTFQQARRSEHGFEIIYRQNGSEETLLSKTLVNAAGPWVNEVQASVAPGVPAPAIELVAGTHIILKQAAPGGVFYVESPSDRRAVFIMPWYGQTLVGTTERAYQGDPAQLEASEHEIEYLLAIVRYYFPRYSQEVERAFAGARVLPYSAQSLFDRSRETLFFTHPQLPGYLSLMGGKLTGYRVAALQALDYLRGTLPSRAPRADTATIKLYPVEHWDVGC